MCIIACISGRNSPCLKNFSGPYFLGFGDICSTFEMYEYLILTFKFKPMKKFSPAMSVIVGLFMLFAGIYSVYGGGKTAVIVKQVKVGGGPVCLSENIPLVFYDSSMSIVEVIASGAESKTGQLIISGNFGTVACERFDLFNGKSIIPIPELEPGFYTIELSIDKNVFAGDFFIE